MDMSTWKPERLKSITLGTGYDAHAEAHESVSAYLIIMHNNNGITDEAFKNGKEILNAYVSEKKYTKIGDAAQYYSELKDDIDKAIGNYIPPENRMGFK